MKAGTVVGRLLACMLMLSACRALAQDDRAVVGRITSISVDDPTETKGLSRDAKRYVVRVEIDGVTDTLLGFGESGKPIEPHKGMLELLLVAMERGWTVSLLLHRDISEGKSPPSYARIVSVTVNPEPRGAVPR